MKNVRSLLTRSLLVVSLLAFAGLTKAQTNNTIDFDNQTHCSYFAVVWHCDHGCGKSLCDLQYDKFEIPVGTSSFELLDGVTARSMKLFPTDGSGTLAGWTCMGGWDTDTFKAAGCCDEVQVDWDGKTHYLSCVE